MKVYKYFQYILYILLVYIYFNDPFYIPNIGLLGRGDTQYSLFILYIAAIFFIFLMNKKFSSFLQCFKKEFIYLIFLVLFSFITTIGVGGEFSLFADHIKYMLASFFVPCFLVHFAFTVGIDGTPKFIRSVLIVGVIGAIGSMICIASPTISNIYKYSVLNLASDDLLLEGFRGFGFSTRLTNDYGFIQGAILALGLYYGRNNKWFYLFAVFVFLSSIFNARTGVIVAVVGIALIFILQRNIKYSILILAISFIALIFVQTFLESFMIFMDFDNKAMTWMSEFFSDINEMAKSRNIRSTGIGDMLLFEMILWPETLSGWLFGSGYSVFKEGFHSGGHSDNGFIIQLNYGGILYFIILMLYMCRMFSRLWQNNYKYFSVFFMISFIILNIKSNFALRQGGALGFYLLIYYYFIYIQYKSNKKTQIVRC